MAKTKISEFSSIPANNTDIDGINIGEGMLPSNVNNSFRELMSQLKNQQAGLDGDDFTVGGNLYVTGTTTYTGAEIHTGAQTFNGAADFNSTANFDGIVTMTGTVNLGAAINGDGGTIDGTVIGSVTPAAITGTTVNGTTITASTGFVGPLTGNVTGNVTGSLTGNASTATTATSATTAGSATTATTATNIAGGGANQIAYNTGAGATNFLPAGTSGLVLTSNGSGAAPTWQFGVPSGLASNLSGGSAGSIAFQSATSTTSFLDDVDTGNAIISGGVGTNPSYGKIGLTTHVSGTLPAANGGTGLTSLGAGVATWLGTPTAANLASAVTDETGSGLLVFNTTPTLTGLRETNAASSANNFNLANANYFTHTVSGATTFTVSNVVASGSVNTLILNLTNGGSAAITWWAGMKWVAGTAPTLTTAGRDVLGFFTYDGGTTWSGLVLGKDIK